MCNTPTPTPDPAATLARIFALVDAENLSDEEVVDAIQQIRVWGTDDYDIIAPPSLATQPTLL